MQRVAGIAGAVRAYSEAGLWVRWGGHGEGLRRSRGDAVGVKAGASLIALENAPPPANLLRRSQPAPNRLLRPEQGAPSGVGVKDLRPLRGRPFGPILDPDASPRRAQVQAKNRKKKDHPARRGLTDPAPSGMT